MTEIGLAQLAYVVGGTKSSAKLADQAIAQLRDQTSQLAGSVKSPGEKQKQK